MPRIQQLDRHVINKIAAGEVIERPASVVKELLENSVDALSTRIEIEIGDGGAELIRITDDGEGIHPDDLLLAVASHATSKIRSADDLFQVQTLGFRGEALASIAEISHFRLRTRTAETEEGLELEVRAGDIGDPRPCGCPVGTQIEVRELFVNTPVRRKFLKTAATELGHIVEHFTRIALANPRLHLVLRHNQKLVYELPATDRLSERLQLFYGSDLASQLIWVEAELNGVRVWGYAAHPSQSKSTRKGQYLFLNGRWIQDRTLQHALGEAYRGLLMVGRYPIVFLFLEMPPDLVDVNVHPTKAEVRFRDSHQLYRLLLSALRNKFLGLDLDSRLRVPETKRDETPAPPPDPQLQLQLQQELAEWARVQAENWRTLPGVAPELPESYRHVEPESIPTAPPEFRTSEYLPERSADPSYPSYNADSPAAPHVAPERFVPTASTMAGAAAPIAPPRIRAMQVHDSYLVAETEEGLTVIDQHALHERVLYEQFRTRVLAGAVESQRLLIPEPVELSAAEAALILEHTDTLRQMGLVIEEFGGGTVLLAAYPALLGKVDPGQLVKDIADQFATAGRSPTRRDILDELLHMMSCKAAVKAGQKLTPEEIDSLLAQRELIDDAHHCPHGRPTALILSRAELDRQFGRMG
ncbi:MAG TPA: DNA mismatch repair endonuclease MutL [Planctomycetaceae bacterium]|nr:DNA mismatch repair endonuclease MutL [Planctomycetaceae bacterium]